MDMAVAPDGRVGIAYFVDLGLPMGANENDYELRYQEWNAGAISEAEKVRVVQRVFGVSLAFLANGQPAVGYLGGDGVTLMGVSEFWHQSDAAISWRSANGTWTEEIVAKHSADAVGSQPANDVGYLVGLSTTIASGGGETFVAWRDSHNGQNTTDWSGSELEFAEGGMGAWTPSVVISGWNDKQGWGGHLDMVVAEGRPAIASDSVFGGPDSAGQNVYFSRRRMDGTWAPVVTVIPMVGDTQSGASLAYDATHGFGIAACDRTQDALYFSRSQNDGATWSEPTPVYQAGTGGWYPSLSINPLTHEPSVAFYICSKAAGANEGSCIAGDDELRIAERIGGIWRPHTVDVTGGWHPKLAHFADGRRVVVYRHPTSGAVNLAVEK